MVIFSVSYSEYSGDKIVGGGKRRVRASTCEDAINICIDEVAKSKDCVSRMYYVDDSNRGRVNLKCGNTYARFSATLIEPQYYGGILLDSIDNAIRMYKEMACIDTAKADGYRQKANDLQVLTKDYTTDELDAIVELLAYLNKLEFCRTAWEVADRINFFATRNIITINTARSGRDVVWYLDECYNVAMYIDNQRLLKGEKEIDRELC